MNLDTSSRLLPAALRPMAGSPVAAVGSQPVPADTYGPARPESLEGIYRRPVFTEGRREAVQIAGIGVMFTGIMAAAALGGKFGPAMMIGAMFAGAAIMAAAR